jgi:alkylated DNA repair dioxygenase AlkB
MILANKKQYHDDGEKTLGPTVASLSLGCESTMHFRPKSNNSIGKNDENQKQNAKGTKKDVLRIILEHGDIMVMHGRQIQELYEVSQFTHQIQA